MPRYARLPNLDPARLDLGIYRGDTFSVRAQLYAHAIPVYIDGWLFQAHIRASSSSALITEFITEIIASRVGEVRLLLSADRTALLPATSVWDLQTTDPYGRVRTLLYGTITADPDITHDDDIRTVTRGRR